MKVVVLLGDGSRASLSNMPTELFGETASSVGASLLKIADSPPHNSKGIGIIFNTQYGNTKFRNTQVALDVTARYLDPQTLQVQDTKGVDPNLVGSEDPSGVGLDVAQLLEAQKFQPRNEQDLQKWQLLARELAQKQEIIHRMMRENDDKNQSLKLATSEVVDLRRTLKMMQSENAILRKNLAAEEASQLSNLVSKEIASMSVEELKHKVIKLAQAYRSERIRNEYFEKALKSANVDLAKTKRVAADLEQLTVKHDKLRKAFAQVGKEMQKVGLYKDTIKKQEKVIVKLEALLDKTLKETQRARDGVLELEKLKTENMELQA